MEKKMEMQQGIYNVFLKQEFVRNMELLTTEEPLYPRDGGSFIDYESDRVSWWEIERLPQMAGQKSGLEHSKELRKRFWMKRQKNIPDFRGKLLSLWKFPQTDFRRGIANAMPLFYKKIKMVGVFPGNTI